VSTRSLNPLSDQAATIVCALLLAGLLAASCGGKERQSKGSEGEGRSAALPAGRDRRPTPDFVLKDVDGLDVRMADFQGKVVLVNFWATWCPPCRMEIPDFVELQRALGPQGLQVVGISLDDEGASKVGPFATQHRVNYPMLVNGHGAAIAYGGITAVPTTFLLDRQGRVVERREGLATLEHWREAIGALLAEK
jgi:cytochrome c biogenesis protein CcmG, thiol:disulfide interchange protein DsbE